MENELTWIEVSESALTHNIHQMQSRLASDTKLVATVKANAYGHGLVPTAKIFLDAGANWLAVISAKEVIWLRKAGITAPILLLGMASSEQLPAMIRHGVRLFVHSRVYADTIQQAAESIGMQARVHANIDTGMGRYGVWYTDAETFLKDLKERSHIQLEGLGTHFATADTQPNEQFQRQKERFRQLTDRAQLSHCANSAALLAGEVMEVDMVRPGIGLYGYHPSKKIQEISDITLKPALSWKAEITQIKQLPAGASISYGATRTLQEEREIAILPVGYYDGVDRKLSNSGAVVVHDTLAPIIGRVCMDLTIIDVTDVDAVEVGDTAAIIGKEEDEQVLATDIADETNTIPYEVLVRIRDSITRTYVSK